MTGLVSHLNLLLIITLYIGLYPNVRVDTYVLIQRFISALFVIFIAPKVLITSRAFDVVFVCLSNITT